MSEQPPRGAPAGSPPLDPHWPEQPGTVLRPDDLSWRHPSQQPPARPDTGQPPTVQPGYADATVPPGYADATVPPPAAWPPVWGSTDQVPVPPPPPQPAHPTQPPRPAGPPPGSVGWLQQHYPAPGDPRSQPMAPQSAQPSAFAPPQPGSPPPVTPTPTPPPARRPPARALLLAGVASVLVVMVVVAALIFGKVPGGQANPPRVTGADAAVHFLEAVAAGDSARALSWQQQAPKDRALLTDTVLRESRQRAPISRIRVTHESATEVELTYLLGEAEVRAQFMPIRLPNGSYKVDRGTTTLQVTRPKQVPVMVNGVRLSGNELDIFPGTYEATTGLANITFAEPRFTVSGPTSFPRLAPAAQLTDTGRAAMIEATRKALDECMKAKNLNPPNCPQQIQVDQNQNPDNNSVRWELVEDPLLGQVPKLTIADDSVAEVRLTVKTRLSVAVQTDGRPGMVNAQPKDFSTQATASMIGSAVTVRFVN